MKTKRRVIATGAAAAWLFIASWILLGGNAIEYSGPSSGSGGGVQSVAAGTNVTLGGDATHVIINADSGLISPTSTNTQFTTGGVVLGRLGAAGGAGQELTFVSPLTMGTTGPSISYDTATGLDQNAQGILGIDSRRITQTIADEGVNVGVAQSTFNTSGEQISYTVDGAVATINHTPTTFQNSDAQEIGSFAYVRLGSGFTTSNPQPGVLAITAGSSGVATVTAGAGLANSGTAADPVLDVGAGTGIAVAADSVALNESVLVAGGSFGTHSSLNLTGFTVTKTGDQLNVTNAVSASSPLTGDGSAGTPLDVSLGTGLGDVSGSLTLQGNAKVGGTSFGTYHTLNLVGFSVDQTTDQQLTVTNAVSTSSPNTGNGSAASPIDTTLVHPLTDSSGISLTYDTATGLDVSPVSGLSIDSRKITTSWQDEGVAGGAGTTINVSGSQVAATLSGEVATIAATPLLINDEGGTSVYTDTQRISGAQLAVTASGQTSTIEHIPTLFQDEGGSSVYGTTVNTSSPVASVTASGSTITLAVQPLEVDYSGVRGLLTNLSFAGSGATFVVSGNTGTLTLPSSGSGGFLQNSYNTTTSYLSGSGTIPQDDVAPPQYNEGDELWGVNFTPTSASSKIWIEGEINTYVYGGSAGSALTMALHRDPSAGNPNAVWYRSQLRGLDSNYNPSTHRFRIVLDSTSTVATHFVLRIGGSSSPPYWYVNGSTARLGGGVQISRLDIHEVP